ncbi:MAG TPA: tetratricopeptide repeat protein, partial [Steroidobacteraceae bacterium]|nr:tetratricopeptide repeat protein [Steroidobacteraceae bacterium]
MNAAWYPAAMRSGRAPQWLSAVTQWILAAMQLLLAASACLALCACASTASRPTTTAPASAAAQRQEVVAKPIDSERRNRQFQQAEALYLSGHLKEAASAFEQLTRAYPRDAHIWLKYGNTLTKIGNYDDAVTAFQTSLTLDAQQGGAAINLALVRLAQARVALDAALASAPAGSPEHRQAEPLQREVERLLG